MKRYYSIDFLAMKHFGLNPTKWMICENIHFTQAITDSGYCEHTRGELAEHHELSVAGLKRIIGELADYGFIKRNSKHHLKTTPKWHKIQGSKNATIEEMGGSKNATGSVSELDDMGSKNATTLPIRENLERDRENTTTPENEKIAFRNLLEEIRLQAPRKSKLDFTEKAFEAYKLIKDKSKIKEHYLKHQELNGKYTQRIAGFLSDYEANIEELNKASNSSGNNEDLQGKLAKFYGRKDDNDNDIIDAEVE